MLQGVIELLKASDDLVALVGMNKAGTKPKIYPNICPEQEQKRYMVLRITGKEPWACKEVKATTHVYSFSVMFFAENYYVLDRVQAATEDVLDKYEGTTDETAIEFKEIRFVTSADSFEKDFQLHVRVMNFEAEVDSSNPFALMTDDGEVLQTDDEEVLEVDP